MGIERLSVKEREDLRERVKTFTVKNPGVEKKEIQNHFQKEGYKERTIYSAINRVTADSTLQDRSRSGRPSTWSKPKVKRLVNDMKHKVGVSSRKIARKYKCHRRTIGRVLKREGLNYRKRQKAPSYSPKQAKKSKKLARKLVNQLYGRNLSIILDDEKYFEFSSNEIPGNSGFYTDDIESCPDDVRFKPKAKFPIKILVWIAISERGISQPFIVKSKSESINGEVYKNECLTTRLLRFINDYHSDGNYLFWPDLATAHYKKENVVWMEQNVNFVVKDVNPPNVPKARPIEDFWGNLTQKVYDSGWQAENEQQLISRLKRKLKEFKLEDLQSIISGIRPKLRAIADKGVFSILKK
jgi:transposase